MLRRVSILLSVLSITAASCASNPAPSSVAVANEAVPTTAQSSPTAVPATVQTTVPTPASTEVEALDNSALSALATWDRYRVEVSARRAIHCALSVEVDPNFGRGLSDEILLGRAFDLYTEAERTGEAGDKAAFEEHVELVDAVALLPWLNKQRAGTEILRLTTASDDAEPVLRAVSEELNSLIAQAARGDEKLDVAPLMRLVYDDLSASYQTDLGCPFVFGQGEISSQMSNFAGTNESFGGRGPAARSRCHVSAAIDVALEALANGQELEAEIVTGAFAMLDMLWLDRSADEAATAAAAMWHSAAEEVGSDLAEGAAEALDAWLTYRASTPEGFILCPLDRGWES